MDHKGTGREGVDWIQHMQHNIQRCGLVNTVMNLRIM